MPRADRQPTRSAVVAVCVEVFTSGLPSQHPTAQPKWDGRGRIERSQQYNAGSSALVTGRNAPQTQSPAPGWPLARLNNFHYWLPALAQPSAWLENTVASLASAVNGA